VLWGITGDGGHLEWTWGTQNGLQGFCNTNWASQEHCHSTSSYIFTVDSGAMSWCSKKQGIVSLSITKVEYVSLRHAVKEAFCIWDFPAEIIRLLHHVTMLCPITPL